MAGMTILTWKFKHPTAIDAKFLSRIINFILDCLQALNETHKVAYAILIEHFDQVDFRLWRNAMNEPSNKQTMISHLVIMVIKRCTVHPPMVLVQCRIQMEFALWAQQRGDERVIGPFLIS